MHLPLCYLSLHILLLAALQRIGSFCNTLTLIINVIYRQINSISNRLIDNIAIVFQSPQIISKEKSVKLANSKPESDPDDLENRSPIFELIRGLPKIHIWYTFDDPS